MYFNVLRDEFRAATLLRGCPLTRSILCTYLTSECVEQAESEVTNGRKAKRNVAWISNTWHFGGEGVRRRREGVKSLESKRDERHGRHILHSECDAAFIS